MSALKKLGINSSKIKANENENLSEAQKQTQESFGFKWHKRDTYNSDAVKSKAKSWLLERYCDNQPEKLNEWLGDEEKIVLDAGCGAGFSAELLFGEYLKNNHYLGVDISDSVYTAAKRFQEIGYPGDFLQRDLTDLPIPNESVDIIFSEGVLHHTDSTENSIQYLATKLKTGGRFLFYVYAKKAVIREFTDDYIRERLKNLSNEEAWQMLKPITQLGITLGNLNIEIDVPEDISLLGIPKGKHNLQRFFYWYICKMFYRPEFSLEEMNHINFDWFRPLNCHRHTKEEIMKFCHNANLEIEHLNVQESGITVVARKANPNISQ